MYPTSSNFQSDLYNNISNMSLMFAMLSPIFGTGTFVIQPASPGTIEDGFSTIPYVSLEASIYEAQSSNPITSPVNVTGGSNTGQQVVSSSQVQNDATATPRVLDGMQTST